MTIPRNLSHIAFDADDTLWAHEDVFVDAKARCSALLESYFESEVDLEAALYPFERRNLRLFGYGVKGFTLSMIETAIELSGGRVTGAEIQTIVDIGKEMLDHPIHLLPGVEAAITALSPHYRLLVITKGDLFAQENKIARSGLADRFDIVEIVSEKSPDSYRRICGRHGISPDRMLMVGNSLRSDILPVVEIGGHAAHLPYRYTWHHEYREVSSEVTYLQPDSLEELVTALIPS